MRPEDYREWKKMANKFEELDDWGAQEDMPFMMEVGDNLCIDGHFTKEQLLALAHKILEVFE